MRIEANSFQLDRKTTAALLRDAQGPTTSSRCGGVPARLLQKPAGLCGAIGAPSVSKA